MTELHKPVKEELPLLDRTLRVLLVEDNLDNKKLILAYLKKSLDMIDTVENGEIAVQKFCSGEYDLVLMDIEMPVMDGYEATKKIGEWESREKREATPAVAVTAHALKEHEKNVLETLGVMDILPNPLKRVHS